jgi:dUTP pyrophosphatase
MEILIKRLSEQTKLPAYVHVTDPGISLFAALELHIEPGQRACVPVGAALAIPVGYIGLIWQQEDSSDNRGISVVSKVVDSGFRKEVVIELINISSEKAVITVGKNIAQMIIQKIEQPRLIEAEDLSEAAEDAV